MPEKRIPLNYKILYTSPEYKLNIVEHVMVSADDLSGSLLNLQRVGYSIYAVFSTTEEIA